MDFTAFLQAASNGGFAVALVAFFLYKIGPRLDRIEAALNRGHHLELLRIVASPHVAPAVKDAATILLKEVEDAQRAGKV